METKRRRIGSGQAEQLQQQGAQQQDYYALLELPPTADFDAIKHAYHKLALKYHPDRNKGNEVECETKFKELAAAYAVLSDPEKRSQYDASHQARFWGQSNDMREVFNQFVSSGSTSSFSDFFGSFSSRSFSSRSFSSFASTGSTSSFASSTSSTSTSSSTSTFSSSTSTSSSSSSSFSSAATGLSGLFGHQGSFSFNKKRPPSKGQNLRTTLHVTFNESVVGCTKTIALKTLVWCGACGGLGVSGHVLSTATASRAGGYLHQQQQQRSSALECSACGGTGTYSQRSSVVTINSTCSACDGKGIVVDETTKCKCCHHGRVHRTKELRIEVPAGVVKDMRKIYEGEGDVGEYGGVAGDLIVVFDVEDSPLFAREGDDATCDVAVSFFQAALGARLAVPGLHPGQLLCLDVPPGTQPHDVLRIENEGFVNVATRQRGHLYVRVVLDIPRSLTPHQADLLARAQLLWHEAEAQAAAAAATESSVASDESAPTASMMTDYASSSYDETTTTTTAPTMMTTAAEGDAVAAGVDGAAVEPPEAAYDGDEVSETAAAPTGHIYEQQEQEPQQQQQQHYDAVEPTTTMPRPTMTTTLPSMFNAGGLHHHHHHQIPLFDLHMNMRMAAAASAATSAPDGAVVGGYECS